MSARLMRRILVDWARAKRYQKRGGQAVARDVRRGAAWPWMNAGRTWSHWTTPFRRWPHPTSAKDASSSSGASAGLSVEETAAVLSVSPETVMRDWKFSKAWLLRELGGAPGGP